MLALAHLVAPPHTRSRATLPPPSHTPLLPHTLTHLYSSYCHTSACATHVPLALPRPPCCCTSEHAHPSPSPILSYERDHPQSYTQYGDAHLRVPARRYQRRSVSPRRAQSGTLRHTRRTILSTFTHPATPLLHESVSTRMHARLLVTLLSHKTQKARWLGPEARPDTSPPVQVETPIVVRALIGLFRWIHFCMCPKQGFSRRSRQLPSSSMVLPHGKRSNSR
ncbi:hypothetical protein HD554DRAFT_2066482 [Boletus coccyginus]|nr:hypothetical protein HD554DRAFT_2066482 [Boletus coccyginus]